MKIKVNHLFQFLIALVFVGIVTISCTRENEPVKPSHTAKKKISGKNARVSGKEAGRVYASISFNWVPGSTNGLIWVPYNSSCGCYRKQVQVVMQNGTYGTIYGPQFVIGRSYTGGITTYSNPGDNSGSQRAFYIESIDQVVNGYAAPIGSMAIRFYPSDNTGEAWPHGMISTITFTIRNSLSYVQQEAVWGIWLQSPYVTTPVYGDDAVTFGKQ